MKGNRPFQYFVFAKRRDDFSDFGTIRYQPETGMSYTDRSNHAVDEGELVFESIVISQLVTLSRESVAGSYGALALVCGGL